MPYPVTPEFNEKMQALERRVLAKAVIDYTDPFLDQSIATAVNEEANISYHAQVADSVTEPFAKIASLDGSCNLDGTYHLAPRNAEEAATHQMGWWGRQLAGAGGAFSAPYPTLTVTHERRPVHTLRVTGDSKREEWPVDFTIDLYAADDTLLRTESVTGNTQVAWSMTLPTPVLDVAKQVLTITRWSHEGRQVKILEFFTSIQETYLADDLMSFNLLEESEVSQASIPIGNISANEVRLALSNKTRKFDIDNDQSPLKGLLKVNRKVRLWLGADAENLESERPASFSRSSPAYNPEDGSQVAVNEPRYVEGPFPGSKALLVEEGTTNILSAENASFEGGTVGNWAPILATRSVVGTAWHGTKGLLVSPTSLNGRVQLRIDPGGLNLVALNDTITFSAYARLASGDPGNVTVRIAIDGVTFKGSTAQVTSTGWTRISVTHTLDTFGTGVYVQLFGGEFGGSYRDVIFDGIQLEKKPYATSFTDSTRSAETLTIPTAGVLSPQEGTWEQWVYVNEVARRQVAGQYPTVFCIPRADGGNGILVHHHPASPNWVLETRNDANQATAVSISDSYTPNGWHVFRVSWKQGNKAVLRIDGVDVGVINEPNLPSAFGDAYVGSQGTLHHLNTTHVDVRLSSIARTDDSDLQAYQSNAPLPVDKWTTLKLSFDGTLDSYRGRPGPAWVPLGTFWTLDDWDSPDDELQATVTARDCLELLSKSTYQSSHVLTNVSLGALAEIVLQDAGLVPSEYHIDAALYSVIVPYAWFQPVSHREALRLIAEAGLAVVYVDRLGVVRMEAFGSGGAGPAMEITPADYFRARTPINPSRVINEVIVTTQPLRPSETAQEVYRSNEPISIAAGQTLSVTVHYNAPLVIEAVASLESPPAGVSIVGATYYGWGAEVEIHNTSGATQQVTLVISGKPLSVMNRERAIARDEQSIIENAVLRYEFPANHLIQSLTQAQTIADTILASAKDPRRDIEIDWRGNPALLLGDRIRVKGADYHVTANEIEWAGSLRETTTARRVI